ncbi:MAG TPA: hypothetical protein VGI30_12970 [Caulobacteraceae bacterium]|jgi:hypothetical protein
MSDVGWEAGAPDPGRNARGFTSADLVLLHEAHQSAGFRWGRSQFSANAFSQFLAIWMEGADAHAQPSLTVIRFIETGAYALMVGGRIVANGKTLAEILPAIATAQRADVQAA